MEESKRKRSTPLVRERLDRIENDIKELRAQVALLEKSGGGAQAGRESQAIAAYTEIRALEQRYCAACLGGNPHDAIRCIWCGAPMPQKAEAPARAPAGRPRPESHPPEFQEWEWAAGATRVAAPGAIPPPPPPTAGNVAWEKYVSGRGPLPGAMTGPEAEAQPAPAYKVGLVGGKLVPVEATAPLSALPTLPPPPPPRQQVIAAQSPAKVAPARQGPVFKFDFLKTSEFWLNKVGIGLLLLGLAFFFMYSIDRGWLNEPVRVGLGLLLGSVLLGFGLVLHRRRPLFSQVLLGGAVAAYYISGYAAYQLFHLVQYEVAFGFMALVTALAFGLAVRENDAALSLTGVLGGLLTPFVLTAPSAGVAGLVVYTCVVLAGVAAIYLYKGWRSLLWAGYVGAWAVFGVAWLGRVVLDGATGTDRWALQAAALFCLAALWAVPVLREALYERHPDRWSRPTLDRVPEFRNLVNTHVYVLAVVTPLLALGFSEQVWRIGFSGEVWQEMISTQGWGFITVALAALYGATAWLLRSAVPRLAYTHALMAILLLTLGVVQIFEGDALIASLAVEATALHFISRRLSDRGTAIYGHIISLGVIVWLGVRLLSGLLAQEGFTPGTLTNLAVIALLAASSFAVWPRDFTPVYRAFVHAGVMAWLFSMLYGLDNWTGLVMLAWAAYGVVVYVLHLRLPAHFGKRDMAYPAHGILVAAALMFAWRISSGQAGDWVVFNLNTLMDAALVAIVAGMSFIVMPREATATYRIAAHFGVLALLWRELSALPDGVSYAMLSWAVYGLGMHYLARLLLDRFESTSLSAAANAPFVGVALGFGWSLSGSAPDVAVFNLPALISLACIGLTIGASFLAKPRGVTLGYWLGAYLAAVGWFWSQFRELSNGDGYVILEWAALATGLIYIAGRLARYEKLICTGVATATFAAVGAWLLWRLIQPLGYDTHVLNPAAASDLAVIALMAGSAFLLRAMRVRWVYLLAAHVALLAWFWREFATLENGNAYVTTAWGVYAIALLVAGLWNRAAGFYMPAVYAGTATLLLVVGKLFLVDLSALDPLWRVLLFMGFGGVFLLLSYFFQNVIRGKPRAGGEHGHHGFNLRRPGRPAH